MTIGGNGILTLTQFPAGLNIFGIMKTMIKYFIGIGLSGLLLVNKALATHTTGHVGDDGSLANPLKYWELEDILDAIAGFLFKLSIPLVVVVIIIGAFYLVTAGGSEDKIKKGKETIKWAIIGFVIILLAASIAALIQNFLEA